MKTRRLIFGTIGFFTMASMLFVSCSDPILPTPDFSFEIDDKTVTFTNLSDDAVSYSWDFGDGSAAVTDENPVHTYDAYGDYDVRLTATNEEGEEIKKITISVVKDWPAITIDGTFSDWDEVESIYSGYGEASGTLSEAKVTTDAAGSKLYIYLKGTINADFPVLQVLINADGDATTGWQTPTDYASNGAEYQFEFFAVDGWAGTYAWNSDPGVQDWPWIDDITSDPDNGDITETSGVIGGSEIEFVIETSLMKDPVPADQIGIYFWAQPSDWSATSGSLPVLMADPLEDVKMFSFQ
ncbi:MAG: PKD domain-containing protein [Bacteroidales bacterium]